MRQVCELLLGIKFKKKTLIFHQNKSSSAFLTVYKEPLGFNTIIFFTIKSRSSVYRQKGVETSLTYLGLMNR